MLWRHGKRYTTEYIIWCGIKGRCYTKTQSSYRYYGAVGVTMCERWRNDFNAFLADVGQRPSTAHSLDRIDPFGNYEPSNVRWLLRSEQVLNTKRRALLTVLLKLYSICPASWKTPTEAL